MAEWEAIQWRFTGKGDRITGFCGHTHRSEKVAQDCAAKQNLQHQEGIWVAREVVYHEAPDWVAP
jgi:hypothetical protein